MIFCFFFEVQLTIHHSKFRTTFLYKHELRKCENILTKQQSLIWVKEKP